MTWDTGCRPSVTRHRSEQQAEVSWRIWQFFMDALDCGRAVADFFSQAMLVVAARLREWVLLGRPAAWPLPLCIFSFGGKEAVRWRCAKLASGTSTCHAKKDGSSCAGLFCHQLASFSVSTFSFCAAMVGFYWAHWTDASATLPRHCSCERRGSQRCRSQPCSQLAVGKAWLAQLFSDILLWAPPGSIKERL